MLSPDDEGQSSGGSVEFPPIFIGGSGRSGTTFLADLMGQHPDISPIYETDFVLLLFKAFGQSRNVPLDMLLKIFRDHAYHWSEDLPYRPDRDLDHHKMDYEEYSHGPQYFLLNTEEFREKTDQFIESMKENPSIKSIVNYLNNCFQTHCEKDEKPSWVNKTPKYVKHPYVLHNWYPDMKLIHIMRDGRDVVASMRRFEWAPDSIEDVTDRWKEWVYPGYEFAREHPEHCIEVKFESLLRMPQRTLTMILRKLGNGSPSDELVETMLSRVQDTDPSSIGKWKNKLSQKELEIFNEKAGAVMKLVGYE